MKITIYRILTFLILLGQRIYINAVFKYDVNFSLLQHPDFPNQCYLNEKDEKPLVIKYLEVVPYPGRCANIFCGRDGWALIYSCPQEPAPELCVYDGHYFEKASFPECCIIRWKCNFIR